MEWLTAFLIIGGIVGWVGWRSLVKHVPGSFAGSMLAGFSGSLLGLFGSALSNLLYLWQVLVLVTAVACVLVLIVDLIIRQVNIK